MRETSQSSRAIVYVDGFNLYWGMRDAYGRRYLWLDLQTLGQSLLQRGQRLVVVRYFTARTRRDPSGGARQSRYLEALSSCDRLETHFGRYQEKHMTCRGCGDRWVSYEEKETDVSIAANLVRDAARGSMDTAIVVSADADLLPAMKIAKEMQPTMAVVAAFPPKRRSGEIRSFATATFTINEAKLRAAQFPERVTSPRGIVKRPREWRAR